MHNLNGGSKEGASRACLFDWLNVGTLDRFESYKVHFGTCLVFASVYAPLTRVYCTIP